VPFDDQPGISDNPLPYYICHYLELADWTGRAGGIDFILYSGQFTLIWEKWVRLTFLLIWLRALVSWTTHRLQAYGSACHFLNVFLKSD